ncbi:MAG: ADP-ribosylglycohydrolase family protein [Chitinophagaceae bacterium]|nr:ADP-ribosylglycohydrolase family protein [Chitinophagaceae bacterium]
MKKILLLVIVAGISIRSQSQKSISMTKQELHDKIKGGWAGQTIGVTFGGPYEFRFNGTFIQEYQPLKWEDGYLKQNMLYNPGLYDDLYMDLTFVDVFEKYGLDAPVDSFANAFAHAGYMLWHANQAARYNILNGIKAPGSGHWKHNTHSEDIDYQIEADYAGLMSPGMPNTASAISDKIGHIMNYGDGWYGGVFMGAMYSLAFLSKDINYIVSEALKTIPRQSTFYQCIQDVITWHKKYPNDWHANWFEIQKKWSSDIACADGIFRPFNIDAKINSAYVVLGLLYGKGDFTRTLDIATRAGQDADCNPSSAGGILGTVLGYDKIPAYWKMGLKEAEDIDFKYTTISLNRAYEIGLKHALQNIERNGGKVSGDNITIAVQTPETVKLEQGFPGIFPVNMVSVEKDNLKELSFEFEGTGFILSGDADMKNDNDPHHTIEADLYIDDKKIETGKFPTSYTTRKLELFWKYELPKGRHKVNIKVINPDERYMLNANYYIVFSDKPAGSLNGK